MRKLPILAVKQNHQPGLNMSNKRVVYVIDFNVFWDEKSIPYVYKTLKSSLGDRGPRPCPFSIYGHITSDFHV